MNKSFKKIFGFYREDARFVIRLFGIKMTFKSPFINRLQDCCCIPDLQRLLDNNTEFVHPVGIVISQGAQIGKNCVIYQNVTIGGGKKNPESDRVVPIVGNNVTVFANAVIIGGITIGDNVIIGAGSVVVNDIPANSIVVGNPGKVIKTIEK